MPLLFYLADSLEGELPTFGGYLRHPPTFGGYLRHPPTFGGYLFIFGLAKMNMGIACRKIPHSEMRLLVDES